MAGTLLIVWDFDTALGQINSTMPYNFNYNQIYGEIDQVDYILSRSSALNIKMTFACLGFIAEEGVKPFNDPELVRKIHSQGHEIASHSWKHEWFPYLTETQASRSLERSKSALEKCIGGGYRLQGFVPPHSRPMSWFAKHSFSLGDRAIYPFHKGADMGSLLKLLSAQKYSWCRVLKHYRSVWDKAFGKVKDDLSFPPWETHSGIVCVPQHYAGFDSLAMKYLDEAAEHNKAVVIVGHPAGLGRHGEESRENFERFTDKAFEMMSSGRLECGTVSGFIESMNTAGKRS